MITGTHKLSDELRSIWLDSICRKTRAWLDANHVTAAWSFLAIMLTSLFGLAAVTVGIITLLSVMGFGIAYGGLLYLGVAFIRRIVG